MQKITALFTTGSGLSLIGLFIYFGLKGIAFHFTGDVANSIGLVISILGILLHPTNMVGGKSIK